MAEQGRVVGGGGQPDGHRRPARRLVVRLDAPAGTAAPGAAHTVVPAAGPPPDDGPRAGGPRITLLGRFEVIAGGAPLRLQPCAQRLLTFVALQRHPVARFLAAATLWPDTCEAKAGANLRSTLWRLARHDRALVTSIDDVLQLGAGVRVDVRAMLATAQALLDDPNTDVDAGACLALLDAELVPGWWDEWIVAERERLRLLQIHALERLAAVLLRRGAHGRALECCLRLVATEPFRESAHRLVIAVHIAEGNLAEALHHYEQFRDLLWRELGLRPSPHMEALVAAEVRGGGHGLRTATP